MGKRTRRPERTKINFAGLKTRVFTSESIKFKRLKRNEVEAVLNCFIEEMLKAIVEYEEIHICRLGQLYRFEIKKRRIKHPKTGEEIIIAPHLDIGFKMATEMRRQLGLKCSNISPKRKIKKDDDDQIPTDF